MKQIPSKIKVLHDAHLEDKAIPKGVHFHYRTWVRYYLDFCEKYHLNELQKENVVHFIKKLKDKKQTAQQQKQAALQWKGPNLLMTHLQILFKKSPLQGS